MVHGRNVRGPARGGNDGRDGIIPAPLRGPRTREEPLRAAPTDRPPRGRRPAAPWLFLGAGAAGFAIILLALGSEAFGARTAALDQWVRARVEGRHAPHLDAIATAISHGITPKALYGAAAALALFLWWRRGWRVALAVALAALLALALNNGAKDYFDRLRPPGGAGKSSHSFPSGHATTSAAVLVTAAFVLWRERLVPSAVAVLLGAVVPVAIAWSRVRMDEHWATDVLAGWCLGLTIAGACGLLHRRLVKGGAPGSR